MDKKTLDQCLYEINMVEKKSMEEKHNAYVTAEAGVKLQIVVEDLKELLYKNGCMLDGRITLLDIYTGVRYNYEESNVTRFRR